MFNLYKLGKGGNPAKKEDRLSVALVKTTPCKDGHGLLNIDGNICFPSLPAVVEEVVAGKDLLPSPSPHLNLSEITNHQVLFSILLSTFHHLDSHPATSTCTNSSFTGATAGTRIQNISEKVAVLPQHLQQLQHLGLSLAVLVRGVSVHNVVQTASSARTHRPRRSRVGRVGGVEVEELDEEGDAARAAHHVAVGGAGGHREQGARHLVDVGAAEESHQGVRRLGSSVAAAASTSASPILATSSLLAHTVNR